MTSNYININSTNDYEIKNDQLILQNQKNNRLQKAKAHIQKLKQINKILSSFRQPLSPNFKSEFDIQFSPIFSHRTRNNQACRDIDEIFKRAKIFHMRDKQLEHNEILDSLYRTKEERLDRMMEMERLKELKYNEDKKKIKKEKNKESVKEIIEQIKEKEYTRLIERERIIKDAELMKRQMKAYENEELREIEQKKIKKMILSKENEAFLKYMSSLRKKQKMEDKEADLKVMKFNRDQNNKMDEELKIQKKLKLLKEQEILKNKEKQEMILEKKEKLRELKDKKIMEQIEKENIQKERNEMIKLENDKKNLIKGYEDQIAEKLKRKEKKKIEDMNEYEEIKNRQIMENEEERRKEELRKIQNNMNEQELIKQMNEKREKKKKIEKEKMEEKMQILKDMDEYQQFMEKYKNDKLKEMEKLKINPIYRAELQKYKIV